MHSTRVSHHVNAPRSAVYRALLDADAVATWRVPDGMSSQVHEFDPREGGRFRVSLSYDAADAAGKSAAGTDTYHGHFARLVPDEQVVEVMEFETADPAFAGTMTMTTSLVESDGGTDVVVVHDDLPDAVPADANVTGTRMALARLAALVERNGDAARAQLDELRHTIDNLDSAIVHLLAERFKCTQRVGRLKARYGMPPADPQREAEQIERLRALARDARLDPAFAEKFLNFVIDEVVRHHRVLAAERVDHAED